MQAGRLYLATSFIWGMAFYTMSVVFMIYQVEIVGLDPLQLVLVGTALEVSAFVFEVPTGMVADTYSRRFSVIVGYLIIGIGFVLMGSVPSFIAIVFGSVLWGLGWTFVSGAKQAWLADEIGESEAAALYLTGAKLNSYGAFAGILAGVLIGSLQLNYSVIVAGCLFFSWGLFLMIAMSEQGFTRSTNSAYSGMAASFKEGISVIRGSPTLLLLMVVGVVYGTFSEGYDRLAAAHLLRDFPFRESTGVEPVFAFGVMTAIGVLLSLLLVRYAETKVDTDNAKVIAQWLSVSTLLIVVFVLLFALSGYVWLAITMYILLQPLRNVIDPLTLSWVNRNLPSASRATIISMHSQSDALGQMAGGPGVGLIGREIGVRVAISFSALLLLPALWLYGRAIAGRVNLREER